MGCPSAAIVVEELVQLGVKRLLRVGTCGGLQPDLSLGDLIVAVSAVPADRTVEKLVGFEPHVPTADFGARSRRRACREGARQAGPRRPDRLERPLLQPRRRSVRALVEPRRPRRRDGGVGALHARRPAKKVQAGCLLTVSDVVVEGEFVRISDEEMRAAVDQMTELALDDDHGRS